MADEIVTWKGVRLEDMEKPQLIDALKHMAERERRARERGRRAMTRPSGSETDPNRWNMDYLR